MKTSAATITSAGYQITSTTPDVLQTDASGGSVVITALTSGLGQPQAGTLVQVVDLGDASAMNKVTFTPGAGHLINGLASLDLIVNARGRRDIRYQGSGAWITHGGEF